MSIKPSYSSFITTFNIAARMLLVGFGVAAFGQVDPGPRSGTAAAGGAIQNLTLNEMAAFIAGKSTFEEIDSVTGTLTSGSGLGPRFNLDTCAGCHAHPAIGGSSPPLNPQIAVATKAGARNSLPPFISSNGPIRVARFKVDSSGNPDGGVHDLFTITGRTDATGCNITQPDFNAALTANNISLRIPTPIFGAGLIEAIDDAVILANLSAQAAVKQALGISGHANRNTNDGSLTRFGWKAQNKSLFIFAGEAYNVEQGVTNDIFPQERESASGCRFNATPEDHIDVNATKPAPAASDIVLFSLFMRTLAPAARGPSSSATAAGESLFNSIGCALCHTPSLTTAPNTTTALSVKTASLFSDLVVHNMGSELADGIAQGNATGNEFRTAPLWGLGQRLFFLHDGRTSDLSTAIAAHSSAGSEASAVTGNYNGLTSQQKQNILLFLRSL